MKLSEFVHQMELIAPPELALEFDNPGLLIDGDGRDIRKVLVALDCSIAVAKEAVEIGADLVLTHHPLFFYPIKSILSDSPATAAACILVKNGIAMYAAHTNLDACSGGVNDVLSEIFGLTDVEICGDEGIARIGNLKTPMTLVELTKLAEEKLNAHIRVAVANFESDANTVIIKRVAVLGGQGGGDVEMVRKHGADAFITGEIKHSFAIDAASIGLSVLDAGHYETESVVLSSIINRLQKEDYGVEYSLSRFEVTSLRRITD